ncbi:MAG: hypothetical protein KH135_05545 [Firmicutes bacterium]|nr:hypothetical protein [Bacillota bacterium]
MKEKTNKYESHYLGFLQLPTGEIFPYGNFQNGWTPENRTHIRALGECLKREAKLHSLLPYYEQGLYSDHHYPCFELYLVSKGVNIILNLSRTNQIENSICCARDGITETEVDELEKLNEDIGILNYGILKECYIIENKKEFRMMESFDDIKSYAKRR